MAQREGCLVGARTCPPLSVGNCSVAKSLWYQSKMALKVKVARPTSSSEPFIVLAKKLCMLSFF